MNDVLQVFHELFVGDKYIWFLSAGCISVNSVCFFCPFFLKEIVNLCEINKNLTYHLARCNFATTITLTNSVPIESVSKMPGHSDLRTTQIYAKVCERKISEDMLNLQKKLNPGSDKLT